jgi:hypothetical protein
MEAAISSIQTEFRQALRKSAINRWRIGLACFCLPARALAKRIARAGWVQTGAAA